MKICSIQDCTNKAVGRGWCHACYKLWQRYGDPKGKGVKYKGKMQHPLYPTWAGMFARCNHHPHYIGRGTIVCERWSGPTDGFYNFVEDMGLKPSKRHSLDRINNNGNYEPSNCRWATAFQQSNNKSNNNLVVGVNFHKATKSWSARIQLNGVRTNLGVFKEYDEAVRARRAAEDGDKWTKKPLKVLEVA